MSKADQLGGSTSFGRAQPVSARRAAIGAATDAPTAGVPDPTELPVALISQNPDNPREELRNLDDLTESIKEIGVVTAITVATTDAYIKERPDRAGDLDEGAKYIVVDGHRRLEGARRAGKKTINVLVANQRVSTDEALLEAAFVANFHRDNMTDLEQAHALEALVTFYGNQTKASKRLGMSQATISSKLSLLKLSPELQAELASGERQVEHVRNLGKLSHEEQRAAADARRAEAQQRTASQARPQDIQPTDESPTSPESTETDSPQRAGNSKPSANDSEPAERTAPTTTASDTPPRPAAKKQPPEPHREDTTAPDAMPWDDPSAVVRIAHEHMSAEDFRTAAKIWQAQASS